MKFRYFWPLFAGALAALGVASAATVPAAEGETQTLYLSGHGSDDAVLWDFYCNGGRLANTWAKIHVPSCWEQEGFGEYNYGYDLRTRRVPADQVAHEQGFYRHDFTVPAAWKDKVVRIVFQGVMTDADVKINGQLAGPTHQGAFYEFKYDITSLLKFGETNRLEIFHFRGRGQLAAGLHAFNNERAQVGARRVNRRRQAGAPRAENQNVFHDAPK